MQVDYSKRLAELMSEGKTSDDNNQSLMDVMDISEMQYCPSCPGKV